MNVAFFLTPKEEVVWISVDSTMRQAIEKMEYHRYTAMPLLDNDGKYVGTITEGDILWYLKHTPDLKFKDTNRVFIKDIPQNQHNKPVSVDSHIEDLILLSISQNFVPVVDDHDVFIGIIKRSVIINYLYTRLKEENHIDD